MPSLWHACSHDAVLCSCMPTQTKCKALQMESGADAPPVDVLLPGIICGPGAAF